MSDPLDSDPTEAEELQEIEKELYRKAREYALGRLDRRECSSRDILDKLKRRRIPNLIATRVVAELQERKLLDDQRFSRMLARQQAGRGKGALYIHQKLKSQGIDLGLPEVRSMTEEVTQTTELESAKAILEKRYPQGLQGLEDRLQRQKVLYMLVRRGFSFSVAEDALRDWVGK